MALKSCRNEAIGYFDARIKLTACLLEPSGSWTRFRGLRRRRSPWTSRRPPSCCARSHRRAHRPLRVAPAQIGWHAR